jgi:C4-dicarboxylate transporter DctQ subunit
VLIYYGWDHFMRAYDSGDSTIDMELPVWPSKLLVPVSFSLLFLRLILQLIGYLRLLRRPDAEPVAVPRMLTVEELARREIEESTGGH